MLTNKHKRYSVQEKKCILDEYEASNISVKEFSALHDLGQESIYRWRRLYKQHGLKGLENKPNNPVSGPSPVKKAILELKKNKPLFGIRKIRDFLARLRLIKVSHETIRRTLKKEGLLQPRKTRRNPTKRVHSFERSSPNDLWQMDIMTFTLKRLYQRVYIIGIIDDHSRYIVGWGFYSSQGQGNVLEVLKRAIIDHGLPSEIMTDNGRQFAAWQGKNRFQREVTSQGINHIRSSPRHPQTMGKIESFWRNIWQEFLSDIVFESFDDARKRIEVWIKYYNHQRPHQGIDGLMPADRYYRVADEVKKTIEAGCQANALEIVRKGEPKKPFYLVGRLGEKELTIKAEGQKVEIQLDGESIDQIELGENNCPGNSKMIETPPWVDAERHGAVAPKEEATDVRSKEHTGGGEIGDNLKGDVREQDRPAGLPGAQHHADPVLPAETPGVSGDARGLKTQETGQKEQAPGPADSVLNQGKPKAAQGEDAGRASLEHSPADAGAPQEPEPGKTV